MVSPSPAPPAAAAHIHTLCGEADPTTTTTTTTGAPLGKRSRTDCFQLPGKGTVGSWGNTLLPPL